MSKKSYTELIREEYSQKYLEMSKKISYLDLLERDDCEVALYKDLPSTNIDGYPVASDFVDKDGKSYNNEEYLKLDKDKQKECELRYFFLPKNHELYVGATGSGKTTGCVIPQLRALSSKKNKPNLFITDPKGELFDKNAEHLKEQGYKIFLLNFKKLDRSDRWNMFSDLYEKKMEEQNIGKNVKYCRDDVNKRDIELYSDISSFNNSSYFEYDNKAFANDTDLNEYKAIQKERIEAELDSLINEIVNMMIVVQSQNDKIWEYGAQDLLKGLINCMLTDLSNPKSGFTQDMLNLNNLQRYYYALKTDLTDADRMSSDRNKKFNNHPLLKDKSMRTKSYLSASLNNAPNTMRSYCGVFDNSMKDWFQAHIFSLTTGNTIDIDTIDDTQPYAIFLITRDYEKSDYRIAGIFIDYVYRHLILKAEESDNPVEFHFLLDEFGNIPKIKDFENKIATARSRNVWFHLYLQSYLQLDTIYDKDVSIIIRDNCNTQVFLGAQNRETKEEFSRQCGKQYVPTFASYSDLHAPQTYMEVPLIPVSSLDVISPGVIYIKRTYEPVIVSGYIRSYVAAEQGAYSKYFDSHGLEKCVPVRYTRYDGEQYVWKKLTDYNKKTDFDMEDDY